MQTPIINGALIPQGGGDSIPLLRSPLVLGRRESCDICLQFSNISGKHCELTFKDGLWIIRDLDSTNGVKVNDMLVMKKILHDGDIITISKRSFKLQYTETGRAFDLAEFEEELEDALNVPLLESAGLAHEPRHARKPPAPVTPPAEEHDPDSPR